MQKKGAEANRRPAKRARLGQRCGGAGRESTSELTSDFNHGAFFVCTDLEHVVEKCETSGTNCISVPRDDCSTTRTVSSDIPLLTTPTDQVGNSSKSFFATSGTHSSSARSSTDILLPDVGESPAEICSSDRAPVSLNMQWLQGSSKLAKCIARDKAVEKKSKNNKKSIHISASQLPPPKPETSVVSNQASTFVFPSRKRKKKKVWI